LVKDSKRTVDTRGILEVVSTSVDSARVGDPFPYGVGMPLVSIRGSFDDIAPYSYNCTTFKIPFTLKKMPCKNWGTWLIIDI
jgi:hypothetical protein